VQKKKKKTQEQSSSQVHKTYLVFSAYSFTIQQNEMPG